MTERTMSGQLTNMHLPFRTIPLLDGRRPIDRDALAELARERALVGADWIARTAGEDGRYLYQYYPKTDRFDRKTYNEVRHAGTTYSLYQCYELGGDPGWLPVADRACEWIRESSVASPHGGMAFAYEDRTKLGGQALAIVALLERRRVLDDASQDDLIAELATFMSAMELVQSPGQYFNSYLTDTGRMMMAPMSDYYPGEALLALVRLAQHFPDGPFVDQAVRAADFLVFERDGDIPDAGVVPRHDHWLAMALSELYPLYPRPGYATVAYLQAGAMMLGQYPPSHPAWLLIGAAKRGKSANFTATATKAEAMNAVWNLASFIGDDEMVGKVSDACVRTAQFQMRVQYDAALSRNFPVPENVLGAWPQDEAESLVRVDFVQHNISALAGMHHLVRTGRFPVASSAVELAGGLVAISDLKTLQPDNEWATAPVVHLVLNATRLQGREVVPFKYLAERLGQLVGALAGGEQDSREPTDIGEVMGFLLVGLQKLGGWNVSGCGASDRGNGIYDVWAEIEDETAGRNTAELAASALNDMLHGRTHSETFINEFAERVMKPGVAL
jgi:hypothetical protein